MKERRKQILPKSVERMFKPIQAITFWTDLNITTTHFSKTNKVALSH